MGSSLLKSIARRIHNNSILANRLATECFSFVQNRKLRTGRVPGAPGKIAVTIERNAGLPSLAWIGVRDRSTFAFDIGPAVERVGDGFFEGVWASEQWTIRPDDLTYGSGVIPDQDSIYVILPKHCFEFVFLVRDHESDKDCFSPSIACCLAWSGAYQDAETMALLEARLRESTNDAVRVGAYRYEPLVGRTKRFSVYRFIYGNFRLFPTGRIRIEQPYAGRTYRSYSEYTEFLVRTLKRIHANANSVHRSCALGSIVALSRGYDSTAAAALAAEAGTRQGVTLAVRVGGVDDSGRDIGLRLGLDMIEAEHVLGSDIRDLGNVAIADADVERFFEFIATAGLGDDVAFRNFEAVLPGKVLLDGSFGDFIWTLNSDVPPYLPSRIPYARSKTEFRLRVGFAFVPVPAIGALFPSSIVRISSSDEMRPFSVGGDYDRPIPRRILEEKGVDRAAFGVRKNATNPHLTNAAAFWRRAMSAMVERYLAARHPTTI